MTETTKKERNSVESKPMNDQIREAADRLRRIEIGDPFEGVYAGFGNFDEMTLRMLEDRTAVLDFALAQLPADSEEAVTFEQAMNRVAKELPEFWEMRIYLERGYGGVTLTDPYGQEESFDNGDHETITKQLNAALEAARKDASV